MIPTALATFLFLGCQSNPLAENGAAFSSESAKEVPVFPAPEDFVPEITNPFFAFETGKKFHYVSETKQGTESNVVEVTDQIKVILGISTTVVHDQVFLNGTLSEDTFDWMAQDKDGNVWYFGEDTKEFLDGQVVSTEGSWEAGLNGNPGIIMLAEPELGLRYKQEDSEGVAEDMAKVVGLSEDAVVPYGSFDDCLKTAEWSLVEPGPRDYKFYMRGVGMVLELTSRGAKQERVELTAID